MPAFALERFERQAEDFLRARMRAEWRYISGQRPGRGLVQLYTEDFPDFTSTELYADLQEAQVEDATHKRWLSSLLATAIVEGRTRSQAAPAARFRAHKHVVFEGADVPWREAPARWVSLPEVSRRHALEEVWRNAARTDLNPALERWQESLRTELGALGASDWLSLWDALRGLGLDQLNRASHTFLDASAAVYAHTLDVYLGQLGFPLDDLWVCDTDWALRAGRFDTYFPERTRMPTLIGSLRELGIDLERQVGLFVEPSTTASVECLPLDVPAEVRVRVPRLGGWPDYANTLRGLGSALAVVQTDPRLSFVQRWLGDESVTIGSGLLLERLVRNKLWLAARLEFETSNDFLIVSRLAWLYRIRRAAALFGFEQRVWQTEPGPGLVGDYTDGLTAALRVRHFGQSYLEEVLDTPWTTLRSAVWLRAELFAAHLHAYLRSEFDDEWWRLPRTGRFLIDELWRPGRRYTAEQLLGFMGYEGFDPAILWNELVDVLGMV